MLRLSQGHLTLLETCPRKFQYVLLEQLTAPTSPEQQFGLRWGDRFHQLMHQLQLGLPAEALWAEDESLAAAVLALQQTAPHLFGPQASSPDSSPEIPTDAQPQTPLRLAEHLRSFALQDHSFSVIYDLLWLEPQRAQIIDWKTYPRPQNPRWLANHWQTRLYCYALVKTSSYRPDQVAMTYWSVRGNGPDEAREPYAQTHSQDQAERQPQPQCLSLPYSATQHDQTHQRLQVILAQLRQWMAEYRQGHSLPQVSESLGRCDRCPFAERCGVERRSLGGAAPNRMPFPDWLTTDITQIPEISLKSSS